jgi:hypothetical protein
MLSKQKRKWDNRRLSSTLLQSKDWNELPRELRRVQSLSNFKTKVFKYLLNMDKKEHICSVK